MQIKKVKKCKEPGRDKIENEAEKKKEFEVVRNMKLEEEMWKFVNQFGGKEGGRNREDESWTEFFPRLGQGLLKEKWQNGRNRKTWEYKKIGRS